MKKFLCKLLLICFVAKNFLVFSLDDIKEQNLYYFDKNGNGKIDTLQIDFNNDIYGNLNYEKIFFYSNAGGLSISKLDSVSGNSLIDSYYLKGKVLSISLKEQDNYLTGLTINNLTSSHLRLKSNSGIGIKDINGNEIKILYTTSFNSYKNTFYGLIHNNEPQSGTGSNQNESSNETGTGQAVEEENENTGTGEVIEEESENTGSGTNNQNQSGTGVINEENTGNGTGTNNDSQNNTGTGTNNQNQSGSGVVNEENTGTLTNNESQNDTGSGTNNQNHSGSGVLNEENTGTGTGTNSDSQNNTGTGTNNQNQSGSGVLNQENNNESTGNITNSGNTVFQHKINLLFQSPSYLSETLTGSLKYNCDITKTDCKANYNLNIDEGDGFKTISTKYSCIWDFGFGEITGEEEKCNPNTITYPIGEFETTLKVFEKSNSGAYFSQKLYVKNEGYKEQTKVSYVYVSSSSNYYSSIFIEPPQIKIQSGLDEGKNCKSSDCNINLVYETKSSKEGCLWYFPNGDFAFGDDKKCNPSYIKYGNGEFKVTLRVYEIGNESNYKETFLNFSNKKVEKTKSKVETKKELKHEIKSIIKLQGNIGKTKTVSGNILSCYEKECSINLDGSESIGSDLKYLWDFGENGTFEGKNPGSYSFGVGNNIISLKVYDNLGNESVSYFYLNVYETKESINQVSFENIDLSKYDLKILSVLPNPVGADNFEFIEIKNYSNEDLNLLGCSLDDEIDSGSKEYFFEDILLKSNDSKKFYKYDTKISINNSANEEVNLKCYGKIIDTFKWDFSYPEGFLMDKSIDLENISEIKKEKNSKDFDIYYKNGTIKTLKQDFSNSVLENILEKNDLTNKEKLEKLKTIANSTFSQKISKQKSGIKVSGISIPNSEIVLKFNQKEELSFLDLLLPKTYADLDSFETKTDSNGVYEYFIEKPNIGNFEIKTFLKFGENLLELDKKSDLEVDNDYIEYISSIKSSKTQDIKEEVFINPKSIITLQGTLGKNKKSDGNKLVCFDVSECSVNLDGRSSIGNKLNYFWNFGNGQTFDKANPASYKFSEGEYTITLTVSNNGIQSTSYFYIEVIPKYEETDEVGKNNNSIFISKAQASNNENINFSSKNDIIYLGVILILFFSSFLILAKRKGIL